MIPEPSSSPRLAGDARWWQPPVTAGDVRVLVTDRHRQPRRALCLVKVAHFIPWRSWAQWLLWAAPPGTPDPGDVPGAPMRTVVLPTSMARAGSCSPGSGAWSTAPDHWPPRADRYQVRAPTSDCPCRRCSLYGGGAPAVMPRPGVRLYRGPPRAGRGVRGAALTTAADRYRSMPWPLWVTPLPRPCPGQGPTPAPCSTTSV